MHLYWSSYWTMELGTSQAEVASASYDRTLQLAFAERRGMCKGGGRRVVGAPVREVSITDVTLQLGRKLPTLVQLNTPIILVLNV